MIIEVCIESELGIKVAQKFNLDRIEICRDLYNPRCGELSLRSPDTPDSRSQNKRAVYFVRKNICRKATFTITII